MQVNSAVPSAADGAKNTTNIAGNSSADEMSTMFLELLVAQISNQNPLQPMDGTEYVSQLAEFSNVESLQSIKNNDYLSITNIVTLFDDLKSSGIVINKLKYSKSILQTILKHREKAHLLSFVNRYKKTIHIKSLQFDANKNMYFMEVSIVYKN